MAVLFNENAVVEMEVMINSEGVKFGPTGKTNIVNV